MQEKRTFLISSSLESNFPCHFPFPAAFCAAIPQGAGPGDTAEVPPLYKQDKLSLRFSWLGARVVSPGVILTYLQSWSSNFPSTSKTLMGLTPQKEVATVSRSYCNKASVWHKKPQLIGGSCLTVFYQVFTKPLSCCWEKRLVMCWFFPLKVQRNPELKGRRKRLPKGWC